MKKILNYITTSAFLLGGLLVQSCNKSDSLNGIEDMDNIEKIADIPLSALSTDTLTTYAFDPVSSPTETSDTVIAVHLSSKNHVGNVTFKMGVTPNDSAFTQFLADNPDYELLPSSLYEIPDSNVTIENAGVLNTGLLPIKFKTGVLDPTTGSSYFFSHNYLLPLSIVDAGGYKIASNFRMIVIAPQVKNAYDGVYTISSGTVTRYTAPGVPANDNLSGSMVGNKDLSLASVNSNTVEISNLEWANGSGVAGIDNLRATIDTTTNLVTMSSLGNATLANIAGAVNKYDPDTQEFTLNFIWNPTGAARKIENLVIKYDASR